MSILEDHKMSLLLKLVIVVTCVPLCQKMGSKWKKWILFFQWVCVDLLVKAPQVCKVEHYLVNIQNAKKRDFFLKCRKPVFDTLFS